MHQSYNHFTLTHHPSVTHPLTHPPLQVKGDKATIDQLRRDQIEAESLARKHTDEIERLKKLLGEASTAKTAVDAAMVLLAAGCHHFD